MATTRTGTAARALPEGVSPRDLIGVNFMQWDDSMRESRPEIQKLIDAGIVRLNTGQGEAGTHTTLQVDPDVDLLGLTSRGDHVNELLRIGADGTTGSDYKVLDPSKIYDEEGFGRVTSRQNAVLAERTPLWMQLAPLAIGALAPMAGAAFLGATGIGLGAAGTAAATGGAAGLAAGNIATGAGASSWLTDLARRAVPMARSQSRGFDPLALLSAGGGSSGQTLATLLRLAQSQGRP
jgi:hypothetical protein